MHNMSSGYLGCNDFVMPYMASQTLPASPPLFFSTGSIFYQNHPCFLPQFSSNTGGGGHFHHGHQPQPLIAVPPQGIRKPIIRNEIIYQEENDRSSSTLLYQTNSSDFVFSTAQSKIKFDRNVSNSIASSTIYENTLPSSRFPPQSSSSSSAIMHQKTLVWPPAYNNSCGIYPGFKFGENYRNMHAQMEEKVDYSSFMCSNSQFSQSANIQEEQNVVAPPNNGTSDLNTLERNTNDSGSLVGRSNSIRQNSSKNTSSKQQKQSSNPDTQRNPNFLLKTTPEKETKGDDHMAAFSCNICGKHYGRKSTLKAHLRHHTKMSKTPSFMCQVSSEIFRFLK